MKYMKLIAILLLIWSASAMAQNSKDAQKTPAVPTHIDVQERTIRDLLYFPFTCINAYMPTREIAWQEITDTFGTCETINGYPGLHAGAAFDFTYRGVQIGICCYDWMDNRTWYDFFFNSKAEADQFYNDLVKDIQNVGIPLTKDNIYGGMSNRKKPVSIFKWVSVIPPVKVKEVGPSNIETADVVGMYKVDLGVYKKKMQ